VSICLEHYPHPKKRVKRGDIEGDAWPSDGVADTPYVCTVQRRGKFDMYVQLVSHKRKTKHHIRIAHKNSASTNRVNKPLSVVNRWSTHVGSACHPWQHATCWELHQTHADTKERAAAAPVAVRALLSPDVETEPVVKEYRIRSTTNSNDRPQQCTSMCCTTLQPPLEKLYARETAEARCATRGRARAGVCRMVWWPIQVQIELHPSVIHRLQYQRLRTPTVRLERNAENVAVGIRTLGH